MKATEWFHGTSFHHTPPVSTLPVVVEKPCPHCGATDTPERYVGPVDRLRGDRWVKVWSCCGKAAS